MSKVQTRYPLPDLLRGLTLISMILYHALWDLVYLFGINIPWYTQTPGYIWQQSICWSFILLSGFVLPLGHPPVKRGAIVFLCGAVVSLVTVIFMPQEPILFGVLTFLGSSMFFTGLLEPWLKKMPSLLMSLISFILFLITKKITRGILNFGFTVIHLPRSLYRNLWTTYVGFPVAGFISSDYFPVLPWICLFLTGFFFCLYLKEKNTLSFLRVGKIPWLLWIGRHSLLIYMLHQPILYLILFACSSMIQ